MCQCGAADGAVGSVESLFVESFFVSIFEISTNKIVYK